MEHTSTQTAPSAPVSSFVKDATSTTPSPAVPIPLTPEQESLQIRRAFWALYEIDDRDDWQNDFIIALHWRGKPEFDREPICDDRYKILLDGFALYFRCFEVRADFSFRHYKNRINANGLLAMSGDWDYADDWWPIPPSKCIKLTEEVLEKAKIGRVITLHKRTKQVGDFLEKGGVLEYRALSWSPNGSSDDTVGIRLRSDRIIDLLKHFDSVKYTNLNY
jgi:hypothetical protein